MDISLNQEDHQFREEVRRFFDEVIKDEGIVEAGQKATSVFCAFEPVMKLQRKLHKKGWSAPHWPLEYGGTHWTLQQRYIFLEEYYARDLPPLLPNALQMIGPLLIDLGTEAQQQAYLPGILSGEDYWAQGYSEPNSGSDLASLSCFAESDGDDYIINGSKIWTTYAHHASKMFMLVRTSREGKPQAGITFLLLDRMDLPGMEVREIIAMDGFPEQCEVFFNNVRVPKANRVGEENRGWSVAKHLLKYERGGALWGPMALRRLELLREYAQSRLAPCGQPLTQDSDYQRRIGEMEAQIRALDYFEKTSLSAPEQDADPAYASMAKVLGSEALQRLAELSIDIAGTDALPLRLDQLKMSGSASDLGVDMSLTAMPYYLNSRATSIFAGTNEVQRDLIANLIKLD